MFARLSLLGLAATLAAAPASGPGPAFTLESYGALRQSVTGTEARYSVGPEMVEGKRQLIISLGATTGAGAIGLFTEAGELPGPGRYPVVYSWAEPGTAGGRRFHACYMPGTAQQPLGFFHSESGWITITESAPGRLAGSFELRARGFLASNDKNENQWVTVRGTFAADGEQVVASER